MSLNINAQYGEFVQFAQQQMDAGNDTAIARDGGEHVIAAATGDKVAKFRRSMEDKQANDTARSLFRKAIVDMFGHESLIPEEVRQAMKLDEDFDQGKPLTARRIMAVKTEVDKLVSATAAANNSILSAIADDHIDRLPENMKAALASLVDDLRGTFGAQLVPNGAKITDIIDVSYVSKAIEAKRNEANAQGRELMPEEIAGAFASKAVERLVRNSAGTPLLAKLNAKNPDIPFAPFSIATQFNKCFPGLLNEIRECKTPDQIASAVQNHEGEMDRFVDVLVRADAAAKGVKDKATEKLAKALNLDKALVAIHIPMSKLVKQANSLASSVGSGDVQGALEENFDMNAPFEALVDRFVEQRVAICSEIDQLDMPESVKDAWKAEVLSGDSFPPLSPKRLLDAAKVMDVAKLESALSSGMPMKIGAEMVNNLLKAVTDEMEKLDSNGKNPIEEAGMDDMMPMYAMLLSYAEKKSPTLARTIDKAQKDTIPQADAFCEKNEYPAAATFFKALAVKGGTKKTLPVTDKEKLAAHVESEVTSVLDSLGIEDEKVRTDVKNTLLGRGNGILAKATGLKELSDFLSTIRANAKDLAAALAGIWQLRSIARNVVFTTIVGSTGLKEDFVEENLQVGNIASDSGKLRFLYDDIVAKAKKGEPIDRDGTIIKASDIVGGFAKAKVAVINAINEAGFNEAEREWHLTGALSDEKWTDPQVVTVTKGIAQSESMKAAADKFANALKAENLQKLDNFQLCKAYIDFARAYYDTFLGQFKEWVEKWGGDADAFMRIDKMMLQFLAKEKPEIVAAIHHLKSVGRMPELETTVNDELSKIYDLKMDYMTLASLDGLDDKEKAQARGAMKKQDLVYDEGAHEKCRVDFEVYSTANRLLGFVQIVLGA